MFGRSEHAHLFATLNATFERVGIAIVAHRGCGVGSLVQNTALGVKAALMSGADMVQVDVAASRDGRFFCFHDGMESELLGLNANLQTQSAWEIEQRSYLWRDRPGRPAKVETLNSVLRQFKGSGSIIMVDRSWWRWPTVLTVMDSLKMHDQLVIKCPAWEAQALEQMRAHPHRYPLLPICSTPEEAHAMLDDPDLAVPGVEVITTTQDSPWFDKAVIRDLHARGAFVLVNTETLTTGIDLFGGLDDERAIRVSPEAAWGPMVDLDVDAIQTDWPWLLRDFRSVHARPRR
jgi:glycerophosphoryl diester phosphodiesterase